MGATKMFQTRKVAPKLHYPLLVLIDWRGFRLLAISLVPIGIKVSMKTYSRFDHIEVWKQ